MKPVIFGLSGLALTDDERSFYKDADPVGYILFKRNIESREQVRALTDSLRDLSGRDDLPILIDQEGGKVQRMQPPVWPQFPAGPEFDRLYDIAPMSAIEAARANAQATALMLNEVGVNVDCWPLLDVSQPDTTEAITIRALGHEPMRVAAMGKAIVEGLRAGGVVGVVKHMPGHGRAIVDTHFHLPTVTASESPSGSGESARACVSIFSTAVSVVGSLPTTVAGIWSWPLKETCTFCAPAITW